MGGHAIGEQENTRTQRTGTTGEQENMQKMDNRRTWRTEEQENMENRKNRRAGEHGEQNMENRRTQRTEEQHRGIIVLIESWGLQATKLWNFWYLSHFTYTSLLTEGNTSSVAGAYIGVGLAIAESFESYRV